MYDVKNKSPQQSLTSHSPSTRNPYTHTLAEATANGEKPLRAAMAITV